MSFSVYAKRKVGFNSTIETIKFTKDGVEFELNKEQVVVKINRSMWNTIIDRTIVEDFPKE